jgi:hypothetical protein
VLDDRKSMANPLGAQQNCIIEVLINAVAIAERLSSMEEEW